MLNLKQIDNEVPGGVYLCQVSEKVSCGACCGLYNIADASYENLTAVLTYRTEVFAKTPRNMDALLKFKDEIEAKEDQNRPLPDVHHCPYIGLIGKDRCRVGCLLHPLGDGNNGIDFRGLSYYGGMACRIFFCPAYHGLSKEHKIMLRESAENWHPYGLTIYGLFGEKILQHECNSFQNLIF